MDKTKENKVNYDDFIGLILGPMNDLRKRYIEAAFTNIDKDKDGIIDCEDITRCFEGWKHPLVKANKQRPEDALHEVLEILDNCTSLHVINFH